MKGKARLLTISFNPFDTRDVPFLVGKEFSSHYGGNIGNLAFSHAGSEVVDGHKTYLRDFLKSNRIQDIDNNFDAILFPAANNINSHEDLGWLADILEATTIPICIFGLGVQASLDEKYPSLKDGTKKFLEVARRRALNILVRGSLSQEFLKHHGINSQVLGCPSNFISPILNLGQLIERKFSEIDSDNCSLILNLEYFRLPASEIQKLTSLIDLMPGSIIFQSDEFMFSMLREFSYNDFIVNQEQVLWRSKYFTSSNDLKEFYQWVKLKGRIFLDVPSWLEHCRSMDLSIGSRFHGNMLAFQAGTPAIVFYHDARTLELANTTSLPKISWEKVVNNPSLPSILQEIAFSGIDYDVKRSELAKVFVKFLESFDLTASDTVHAIAASI